MGRRILHEFVILPSKSSLISRIFGYNQVEIVSYTSNGQQKCPFSVVSEKLNSTMFWLIYSYDLKVIVRACYGAYFVAHVFEYLAPNFASGRPA